MNSLTNKTIKINGWNIVFPPGLVVDFDKVKELDVNQGCKHELKQYIGFSESYKFCVKCPHKENL